MEEASHQRVHTAWLHWYDILEKWYFRDRQISGCREQGRRIGYKGGGGNLGVMQQFWVLIVVLSQDYVITHLAVNL